MFFSIYIKVVFLYLNGIRCSIKDHVINYKTGRAVLNFKELVAQTLYYQQCVCRELNCLPYVYMGNIKYV